MHRTRPGGLNGGEMHRTRSKVGIGNASDTAWFAHITTTRAFPKCNYGHPTGPTKCKPQNRHWRGAVSKIFDSKIGDRRRTSGGLTICCCYLSCEHGRGMAAAECLILYYSRLVSRIRASEKKRLWHSFATERTRRVGDDIRRLFGYLTRAAAAAAASGRCRQMSDDHPSHRASPSSRHFLLAKTQLFRSA